MDLSRRLPPLFFGFHEYILADLDGIKPIGRFAAIGEQRLDAKSAPCSIATDDSATTTICLELTKIARHWVAIGVPR